MNNTLNLPVQVDYPVNAAILRVSEDRLQGFQEDPFAAIAFESGVPIDQVIARIRAMVEAGVVRRVRQDAHGDQPGSWRARRMAGAPGGSTGRRVQHDVQRRPFLAATW